MKVSIAMATFNGERFLRAQLESFIQQSRRPDEVVISDDGSTDGTFAIVRDFAEKAPFPVLWFRQQTRVGYGRNFERALAMCSGEIVFLSDQDDVWFPRKIQSMVSLMAEDERLLVVMCDAELTGADLVPTGLSKLGQIQSAGFGDSTFVMGCCVAVRRQLLELCLPLPLSFPWHDQWIVRLAEGLGRKRILPDILQVYRRHGANESTWIVNRLHRVTRWHVRLERLSHWRASIGAGLRGVAGPRRAAGNWEQLALDWVEASSPRVSGQLRLDLLDFRRRLEARAFEMYRRDRIRRLPFLSRLRSVVGDVVDGKYVGRGATKRALGDLVVPLLRN